MTKLSSAAYEVVRAAHAVDWVNTKALAAALRAAALHLHAEEVETCGGASYALVIEVDDLIAIADELEASSRIH
jgi:hypothetical protein